MRCKTQAFPTQTSNFQKPRNSIAKRRNKTQGKNSTFRQNQNLELPGIDPICKPELNPVTTVLSGGSECNTRVVNLAHVV